GGPVEPQPPFEAPPRSAGAPPATPAAKRETAPEPAPDRGARAAFTDDAPAAEGTAGADGLATRDEARLVGMAREMLARHDPASALVILDGVAHRYPGGILLQEREALYVSA